MSDNLSNGHTPPDLNRFPRIAPPEGQRTARGTYSPPQDDDSDESELNDTPAAPETTWKDEYNQAALEPETPDASELTVADVPPVEDTYEPPLGLTTESGSSNGGSGNNGSGGGGGTDDNSSGDYYNSNRRPDTPKDVELGLLEHLNELRFRLLRCFMILALGMLVTWNYGQPLQDWFAAPIIAVLKASTGIASSNPNILVSNDPMGFFTIRFQFSMVSALILTAPFLFWQVWRFIEPALTNVERRYSVVLVPFSSVLFFLGVGLGYAVSPLFFKFFLAFQPTGVAAMWDYGQSIVLMAKMLLVFGVMFEVPVVVIFLNKIGILSRNILIEYWRHAVIVIFTVVAILTPTWDPLTMTICAVPPCILYMLSIWLVKWL